MMAYYLPGQKAWFRKRQIDLAIRIITIFTLVVLLAIGVIVRLLDSKNELRDQFELRALRDRVHYRGLETQLESMKEKYRNMSGEMEALKSVGQTPKSKRTATLF
jgi:hypothetical protein